MELKRHLDLRKWCVLVFVLTLSVYLIVGLQPVEAVQYEISSTLEIGSIGLKSDVTKLRLIEHRLDTPAEIVGSYTRAYNKTLLIGHATTVFQDLNLVNVGEQVQYNGKNYEIQKIELYEKADVDMETVLEAAEEETLVIMTCAGEIHGTDASHRLLVTAVLN